ncbi:MAG: DUF885 domain-containing protein [Planctomycetota bacterium]
MSGGKAPHEHRPSRRGRSPFTLLVATSLLFAIAVCATAAGAGADPSAADSKFDALVDEYYADYSRVHPSSATDLGIHDHDSDLEDLSPEAIAREAARLGSFATRFAAIDSRTLAPMRAADRALVLSSIDAQLLESERIQGWKHRADTYTNLANGGVYVLVKRASAPEATRLEHVIARTEKIPALIEQAKKNLADVPKVNIEIALDDLPGVISFFKEDVPAAFPKALQGEAAAARWKKACEGACAALESYQKFLEEKLPIAKAGFALGAERFAKKLAAEEMLTTPLDALLARGEEELRRLQKEFEKTAARIDPKKPPREVQAALGADHAAADKVIPETQARLTALRDFLIAKQIVTVPSDLMPRVEETPPCMRSTTLASMFTPGPFEKTASDAIFNVTLPDPKWPKEKADEYLAGALNRTVMDVTAIHEAFPGHFVQFIWLPRVESKVRKFEGAASNSEGWAHYCEQMLLDEGWGDGDPRLRLAQIQDALLRAARYVAGIRMHVHGMTFDESVRFFDEQGYQAKEVALMETRRGTGDPTYLYYTWGKLEILALREAYKKKLGDAYTLQKFHDAFLAQGSAPLPLVREALLRDPAPKR